MKIVKENNPIIVKNDNLKNLNPFQSKKNQSESFLLPSNVDQIDLSKNAKELNSANSKVPISKINPELKAVEIAKAITEAPVLPIISSLNDSKIQKQITDKNVERVHYIKKPAVIFIEGFSAFGISNGDGINDMYENFPESKKFSWNEKNEILHEIKKHSIDQPVVLVGHSFGGDTAVEIANDLNSAKNGFRPIDLIISVDSVGMNNTIMPINVKRNLNFFQEGLVPFLHGNPNIARNTDYTEVINELRSELHSKIEDSPEVQFKIFEAIHEILDSNSGKKNSTLVLQINLEDLISQKQND